MTEPVVATSWVERPAAQILSEAFKSDANWNESYWQSDTFDTLLSDAGSTLVEEERIDLYVALQHHLRDDGGVLIPFHINKGRVISSNLVGIGPINLFSISWHEVYFEE